MLNAISSMPETTISSEKSKKYDRQLRLWGDHGQIALENAKVCLINATATGTEILKNLILPGIGSFTIIDSNEVTGQDLGCNFFLTKDYIGKSRALGAAELLMELNEETHGDYMTETVDSLLENNPLFFTRFSLIIATSLQEKTLLKLSKLLWDHAIPLVICNSYGMFGYLRIVIKEHTIVESHPDDVIPDLRLDVPFEDLITYCDHIDMEKLSKKDHMHTPWLVLIYKYLQQWKQEHEGNGPKNYKEKKEFKELIRSGILKNENGIPENEDNFDEAINRVNTALVPSKVPSDVLTLFEDNRCINMNTESKSFWIMLNAVKQFVNNEGKGLLPLRGSIPDMTADSERYIALQNCYLNQAERDITAVKVHLHKILHNIEKSPDLITDQELKHFCKNVAFVKLIRCTSLEDEYNPATFKSDNIGYMLDDEDNDSINYVMLRACSQFFSEFNYFPGYYDSSLESDASKLKLIIMKLLQEWNIASQPKTDYIQEYCRYGGCELHTVAAYMGGVGSQEVIKLLTKQFVPADNTYIYNSIKQSSITLQL